MKTLKGVKEGIYSHRGKHIHDLSTYNKHTTSTNAQPSPFLSVQCLSGGRLSGIFFNSPDFCFVCFVFAMLKLDFLSFPQKL